MARGRRCCCCEDLYGHFSEPYHYRRSGKIFVVYDAGVGLGVFPRFPSLYVDYINEYVYAVKNDPTLVNQFLRYSKDLKSASVLPFKIPSPYFWNGGFAVDPRNRYIFYGARQNSPVDSVMRRVNFDGSNDIAIVDYPPRPGETSIRTWQGFQISSDGHLFSWVSYVNTGVTTFEIHRYDLDGSNDTIIYSISPTTGGRTLAIDNVSKTLFFMTGDGTPINSSYLSSCDFNGGNQNLQFIKSNPATPPLTTLPTNGAFNLAFAGWSHKNRRLYFQFATTVNATDLTNQGLYSCLADGSDIRPEVLGGAFDGLWTDEAGNHIGQGSDAYLNQRVMKLGCGYEKMGASTLAS